MKYPIKSVGIKHLDWISLILETELPAYSKMLAMYLSTFMNKHQDIAWPSHSRIQKQLSINTSTVCKYLKLLEEEGWIIRETGNSTKTTRYIVGFPKSIEQAVKEINGVPCETRLGTLPDKVGTLRDKVGVPCHTDTNQQYNQQLNQPINKKGRFTPPTLKEVNDYVIENSLTMDAEIFVDHFSSNGWKVSGRAAMKDWKAAVRNWAKRQASYAPKKSPGDIRNERLKKEFARNDNNGAGDNRRALSALTYGEEN